MATTDYQKTANFIAEFEGFISTAKWDVNAWRLGFGSDTEGPEQRRVTEGMTTTRDRALQNLALRVKEFEHTIIGQVTEHSWDILGVSAKCALLDMAYNYGSLPGNVSYAVCHQLGVHAIAMAIRGHEGDNHGINAHRREVEAKTVATDYAPAPSPPQPSPVPAPVDPKHIVTIRDVQEALNEVLPHWVGQLYKPLTVDGVPGPQTRGYIEDFQKLTGLPVDGFAGEQTIARLEEELADPPVRQRDLEHG